MSTDYFWLALYALPLSFVFGCARVMDIGSRARGQAGASSRRLLRRGSSSSSGSVSSGTASGSAALVASLRGGPVIGASARPIAAARGATQDNGATAAALRAQIKGERQKIRDTVGAHRAVYSEKESIARAQQAEQEGERRREEEKLREQLQELEREREDQERRLAEERANAELRNVPGRDW